MAYILYSYSLWNYKLLSHKLYLVYLRILDTNIWTSQTFTTLALITLKFFDEFEILILINDDFNFNDKFFVCFSNSLSFNVINSLKYLYSYSSLFYYIPEFLFQILSRRDNQRKS